MVNNVIKILLLYNSGYEKYNFLRLIWRNFKALFLFRLNEILLVLKQEFQRPDCVRQTNTHIISNKIENYLLLIVPSTNRRR